MIWVFLQFTICFYACIIIALRIHKGISIRGKASAYDVRVQVLTQEEEDLSSRILFLEGRLLDRIQEVKNLEISNGEELKRVKEEIVSRQVEHHEAIANNMEEIRSFADETRERLTSAS